jgi:hypothetical protein
VGYHDEFFGGVGAGIGNGGPVFFGHVQAVGQLIDFHDDRQGAAHGSHYARQVAVAEAELTLQGVVLFVEGAPGDYHSQGLFPLACRQVMSLGFSHRRRFSFR